MKLDRAGTEDDMPELPDVEVFRRYMNATSLHQKIAGIEVDQDRVIQDITPSGLGKKLKGRQFERTRRHGKHMFACVDKEFWLMFHFGMTGFLKYFKRKEESPPHTRLLFHFENGYHLAYDNQRMLGKIQVVENAGDFVIKNKLGPDALDVSLSAFKNLIKGRRAAVKTFLMNQSMIAGIGNIYSDEILFQAEIHPNTLVKHLDGERIANLHKRMVQVLKTAIEKKADPDLLPADFLIPHRGRENICPRCGGDIKKIKVNSRGTYFCPRCQPPPKSQ
jgi:formamidopyrimidine-DNA glycosylase